MLTLLELDTVQYCTQMQDGHPQPEEGKLVILANWNNFDQALQDELKAQGHILVYEDEYLINHDKAWAMHPSYYGEELQWMVTHDGTILDADDDPLDWIWACELTDHLQPIQYLPSFICLDETEYQEYDLDSEYPDLQDVAETLLEKYESVVFQRVKKYPYITTWYKGER